MTYYVSTVTLNPTHSLAVKWLSRLYAKTVVMVRYKLLTFLQIIVLKTASDCE